MNGKLMVTLFLIFSGHTTAVNAIPIKEIADLLSNFDTADFKKPGVIFNETEKTFDLAITGSLVDHELDDDTGSFTEMFDFDFWHGMVTFGQVDGQFNPDSITASISIFHQAGVDRPHPGDLLKGDIYTFPSTLLKAGDDAVKFDGMVPHSSIGHVDRYFNGLFSVAGSNGDITGWNFNLKGVHVPTPPSLALLALGLLGLTLFASRKKVLLHNLE